MDVNPLCVRYFLHGVSVLDTIVRIITPVICVYLTELKCPCSGFLLVTRYHVLVGFPLYFSDLFFHVCLRCKHYSVQFYSFIEFLVHYDEASLLFNPSDLVGSGLYWFQLVI